MLKQAIPALHMTNADATEAFYCGLPRPDVSGRRGSKVGFSLSVVTRNAALLSCLVARRRLA